ncbi:hypothetical protein HXX76_007738 [Chlamydomonas incerta]|uniref:Ion transport domain-containing protein n=1 Tax=Chlamydomonas incerta TaxID=51695 RepID=A0A835T2R7_CHLIN|nr:hypothetical protein HXX76_007738 [Chlamydomonas incerta]|eukprot:KAG2434853.1 hypothetical protein HXX76_007738 [Chlamydomonas incerta]
MLPGQIGGPGNGADGSSVGARLTGDGAAAAAAAGGVAAPAERPVTPLASGSSTPLPPPPLASLAMPPPPILRVSLAGGMAGSPSGGGSPAASTAQVPGGGGVGTSSPRGFGPSPSGRGFLMPSPSGRVSQAGAGNSPSGRGLATSPSGGWTSSANTVGMGAGAGGMGGRMSNGGSGLAVGSAEVAAAPVVVAAAEAAESLIGAAVGDILEATPSSMTGVTPLRMGSSGRGWSAGGDSISGAGVRTSERLSGGRDGSSSGVPSPAPSTGGGPGVGGGAISGRHWIAGAAARLSTGSGGGGSGGGWLGTAVASAAGGELPSGSSIDISSMARLGSDVGPGDGRGTAPPTPSALAAGPPSNAALALTPLPFPSTSPVVTAAMAAAGVSRSGDSAVTLARQLGVGGHEEDDTPPPSPPLASVTLAAGVTAAVAPSADSTTALLGMEASTIARHLGMAGSGPTSIADGGVGGDGDSDGEVVTLRRSGAGTGANGAAAASAAAAAAAAAAAGQRPMSSPTALFGDASPASLPMPSAARAASAAGGPRPAPPTPTTAAPSAAGGAGNTVSFGPGISEGGRDSADGAGASNKRPPPGTPRRPRPDEIGRTEYLTACPPQGLEYQTILRIHQRAILCGAVRKCARLGDASAGGRSFRGHRSFKATGHRSFKAAGRQSMGGGAATTPGGAAGGGGGRAPAWLLLSGGEDGYVLWDLGRGRPLLMSLEESGPGDAAPAAASPPPFGPAPPPPAAAAASLDNDLERRSSVGVAVPSAAPTRPPPTNMAAFKQYLSLRRPGAPATAAAAAADTDSDTDGEDGDDPLRRARKAARLAAAGADADAATAAAALQNGKTPLQAANLPKARTMQRPGGAKASRPAGFGANGPPSAGLPGLLHSSGEESGAEGGEDGAAAAWQGASYRNMITAVCFVSDYSWATCHPGGAIRVWRANMEYTAAFLERTLTGHTGYINNISSYCGGRLAVTTGLDTTARSWDLTEGRQIACFTEHENEVTAVAVMDSGKMALTTAEVVPEVASAMLWDPKTGKLFHTLVGHHGWLHGVALSERRKIAVAVGEHATLFIWNIETGNLLLSKRVASDGVQRWASINSDGNFLCFGSAEGVVRVVETYYGCELARFDSTWVDNEFHSISACFFCDDELHDDPEHWNNKFLSLKGDGQDVKRLFGSRDAEPAALARTISTKTGGTVVSAGGAGGGGAGGGGGPPGIATSAMSTLIPPRGGDPGNRSMIRSKMVHSVRAAAAIAAIGRAAAAGAMSDDGHSDFDEDELIDEDDPDPLPDNEPTAADGTGGGRARQSGGGAAANAGATAASTAMFAFGNLRNRIGGGTGDGSGNHTNQGGEPGSPGGGNYKPMGLKAAVRAMAASHGAGSRRVVPLPRQLERVNTANKVKRLPATQPKAKEPAAGGKAARFALPADPDAPSTQSTADGANTNGPGNDADTPAAAPGRTRFAPTVILPGANSDSEKDAAAKRVSSGGLGAMVPLPPGGPSTGLFGQPATLPSVAAHLPSPPVRPFAKAKSMARGAGPVGLPGAVANAAASKDAAGAVKEAAGGGAGGVGVLVGSHHPVVRLRTGAGLSGDSISRKRLHLGGGNSSRPNSAGSAAGSVAGARHSTLGAGGSVLGGLGGVTRSGPSGANLQELLAERDATELEMSPFGRRIVSLSGDGTVRVWSLLGVSVRRELPRHPEMVNEVAISRDRSLVVTVTENEGCLRAFSLSTGHLVATVPAHVGFDCDGVALSDDARLVSYDPYSREYELEGTAVTCSDDTTIKIWDLGRKGGPACVRILYGHAGGVTGVCWIPGSSRVLSVGEDRSVLEWEAGPAGGSAPVARMDHVHEDAIIAVVTSHDGRRALTCSMDRTARLWELLSTRGSTSRVPVPALAHVAPASTAAAIAAAAAAIGGPAAGGAAALEPQAASRPELHRFTHDNSVIHGAFSPDGRHIVTCSADCTVRVWDADNGKQLMCFEGHSRTVTRCLYLNSYVVATASRDGTIRCWDVQRKRRLPSVAPPFALEADSFEAMVLLPSQRCGYGFPEVLASLTSGRVVVYDPTYRQPLPEQLLLQLNPDLELLGPPDVEDLVVDFPGLLVMPIRDGNTMLHMAAMSGDFVLLRALLAGIAGGAAAGGSGGGPGRSQSNDAAAAGSYGYYGYGVAPPLPLNFVGQTPLDLAVAAGHRRCAELLLGTELCRPPEQRLAVLRAWNMLAEEMPTLLVSFLKALSLDPVTGLEEDVLFAPMRAADEVMTQGAEDLAAADLWLDHVNQLREDLERLPWYAHVWPLRHWMRDYREKPTRPSIAGLPYVALSARNMEHSPLGVLVQHGLSQALASDVMYAVLFYKWESFARAIFMKESLVFIAFLALYLVASTMSVLQSPHVRFDELYDMSSWQSIIRVVLEGVVALMALHDIYGEITEVVNAGWYMYLAGSQGSWNGIEMSSCLGILLAFGLQLGSFEGGSRFMMSLTTILLGLRLLKVASGPEHTGVFVQALLRIVANLRFFILILVVLVLTFSFAFWQIMSIDLAPSEDHRDGKDFDTLGNAIVQAYALGVIGQMNGSIGEDFAWRPWVQVLALTYTFLVTVILLNLLVAVMSDTYSVVKEHARSEWLLLRAKLILEIESSLPDGFFKDTQRSCPRWLHCLKVDGGRRGDESLIESMRGPIARNVLNTDLKQTEGRLVEELHDVRDTLRLLHADVGTLRTALAAGGVSLPRGGASANPIYAPLGVGGTSQRFGGGAAGGASGLNSSLGGLFGGGMGGGNGPGSAAIPTWSTSGGVGSAAVAFNARLQSPPMVRLTSLSSERGLRIGSTTTSRHSLFDRDSRKHL